MARAAGLVIACAAQAARGILAPSLTIATQTVPKFALRLESLVGFLRVSSRDASTGIYGESTTPCDAEFRQAASVL